MVKSIVNHRITINGSIYSITLEILNINENGSSNLLLINKLNFILKIFIEKIEYLTDIFITSCKIYKHSNDKILNNHIYNTRHNARENIFLPRKHHQ